MDFTDILNRVRELTNKSGIKVAGTAAVEAAKIRCPPSALLIEAGRKFYEEADRCKLESLIQGLAHENNEEKTINELYSYVSNEKKAFLVSNIIRQSLLSQSRLVCCILGIILADLKKNDSSELSYEDAIILYALQTATDYEIRYLKEIYENYVVDGYIEERLIGESEYSYQYNLTLDWCKFNRVIGVTGHRAYEGLDKFGEFLIINSCTAKFMEYIYKARQVFKYGE